jgi:molecular chaperone DnaK (HSP70)
LRCGIDLGTTFSAISWYDDLNRRVVSVHLNTIADGLQVVPSVVYFPEQGEPIVGKVAANARKQFPDRVVVAIKRSMGDATYKFGPVDGREHTPQEVSAEILKALVRDARDDLGEEVTDVVITVPAYFGDNECNATKEAGELAGLNVIALLPEPHAAALAYSVEKADDVSQDQTVQIANKYLLVYDLGGGTFDVTLIHTASESTGTNALDLNIKTLAKRGNAHRGGLDWDDALAGVVAEKIMAEHGVDVRAEPRNDVFLLENSEEAKRHLSASSPAYVLANMGQYQAEVSRAEFEDATRNLLLETRMLLEEVLDEAEQQHGLKRDDITIMLTGGATKMPMVREMIEEVTARPPLQYGNPELLVANGAAYWAHLLQEGEAGEGQAAPPTIVQPVRTEDGEVEELEVTVSAGQEGLVDTIPYSVGVEVLRMDSDGSRQAYNSVVIPCNSQRGQSFEKVFYKSDDGMSQIRIVLYMMYGGETESIDECERLAEFLITGLS